MMASPLLMAEEALVDIPHQRMKGIGFVNVKAFVAERYPERWTDVIKLLSPEDQLTVNEAIAVGWYDVLLFARLLRAVDEACGRGDLGTMEAIGKFEAEQDLNRVLRVFIRVLSPLQIFRVEGRLWSHFQDAGKWESHRVAEGVDARLTGWAIDTALCSELAGYLVRLVQFTGGKDVRVLHPTCRANGDAHCLFQYRWR
jgi:predicted hydrocarbon binding protein